MGTVDENVQRQLGEIDVISLLRNRANLSTTVEIQFCYQFFCIVSITWVVFCYQHENIIA